MTRIEHRIDLGVWDDDLRASAFELRDILRGLIPHAQIEYESVKSDFGILSILIETETPPMA